jgi:hypothetical protein
MGGTLHLNAKALRHGEDSGSVIEVLLLAKDLMGHQYIYQILSYLCHQ